MRNVCENCQSPTKPDSLLCEECEASFMDLCELNGIEINQDALQRMERFYEKELNQLEE